MSFNPELVRLEQGLRIRCPEAVVSLSTGAYVQAGGVCVGGCCLASSSYLGKAAAGQKEDEKMQCEHQTHAAYGVENCE